MLKWKNLKMYIYIEDRLWDREKYWQSQLFTTTHGMNNPLDLYSRQQTNKISCPKMAVVNALILVIWSNYYGNRWRLILILFLDQLYFLKYMHRTAQIFSTCQKSIRCKCNFKTLSSTSSISNTSVLVESKVSMHPAVVPSPCFSSSICSLISEHKY